MSYTNQTQHYALPQYVGTDVPAWLTDINQAFAAIDTGMNAAKTQADSASTAAGQAANDVAALTSTVNAQAAQISAAAQAASAAQTTANTADGKADANATNITGLDERVTALEQGGGGSSEPYYEDVVATAGASVAAPVVTDKVPYAAADISGVQTGSLYVRNMGSGAAQIRMFAISGTTISAANLVAGTIRIFYTDINA